MGWERSKATTTTCLGIGITINQLGMQSLGLQVKKDPYWHHGNIVIFFQAQRCVMKKNHQNAPWIGGGGRDNPAPGIVYSCDYAAVKLFLVPSLNEESLKSSGEHQATFIQRIGKSGLEKIFPHNSNPTLDGLMTNGGSHSMAHKYLPYIHNQVLEIADPARPMGRKEMRDAFQRDMELAANSGNSNQDELERNRIFYQLQNMLSVSLDLTRMEVTGKNALIRYEEMTEEEVELSK
jgi:type VI secretion system protein VasL